MPLLYKKRWGDNTAQATPNLWAQARAAGLAAGLGCGHPHLVFSFQRGGQLIPYDPLDPSTTSTMAIRPRPPMVDVDEFSAYLGVKQCQQQQLAAAVTAEPQALRHSNEAYSAEGPKSIVSYQMHLSSASRSLHVDIATWSLL